MGTPIFSICKVDTVQHSVSVNNMTHIKWLHFVFFLTVTTWVICSSIHESKNRRNKLEGIHFFSLTISLKCSVAHLCRTLCNPMDCSQPGSSVHWESPGKNTGVSCHVFFQGIFPTQRLNLGGSIEPRSPTLQVGSLPSEHQGSPWAWGYTHKLLDT